MPLPPPPAAALIDERVADLVADREHVRGASRPASVAPGTIGTPAARMRCARRGLRAHQPRSPSGGGPIHDEPGLLHGARERGVLGEEAVAGMDRLGARAQRRPRRSRRRAGSSPPPVPARCRYASSATATCSAPAVGLGVDGDASDPELAERAEDADRDLAAVGDEHLARRAAMGRVFSPTVTPPGPADGRARRRGPGRGRSCSPGTSRTTPTGRRPSSSSRWRPTRSTAGSRAAAESDLGVRLAARPDRGQGARARGARDAHRRGRRARLDGRADRRARDPRLRAPARRDRARRRARAPATSGS